MLLDGLHVPVATPFYPDGRVYLKKLEHNVARYSMTPAAGIAVLGPAGEAEMLTDAETREVLAAAVAAVSEEKVIWAGVGKPSVVATLELADYAAALGYDVALVRVPEVEPAAYFAAVADGSRLPVVVWDAKGTLSTDQALAISRHPQVIGIVTTGDVAALVGGTATKPKREVTVTTVFAAVTARMSAPATEGSATFVSLGSLSEGGSALAVAPPKPAIKTRTKLVGFQVIGSANDKMVSALKAGAAGTLTEFTCSAPQASYEVYAAWKDGDPKLAEEKQARIAPAAARIEELGMAAVKYGSELTGYYGAKPRLPRVPLTMAEKAEIERLMDGIRS